MALENPLNSVRTLLIAGFMALLWGPLVLGLLSPDVPISTVENRPLAVLPEFPQSTKALKNWPTEFAAYYDDHLGGREALVYWHNRIKYTLGIAPSDKVLLGRKDWLYYAGTEAAGRVDPIRDLRGKARFTDAELARWAAHLDSKQRWLAAQGIRYLFVIAPNKASIYPEFLPSRIQPGFSRTDQFVNYLAQHSQADVLDLRPVLLAAKAKAKKPLYHRTDTHWNTLGAWQAQKAILTALRISSHWPSVPQSEWRQQLGGDLAQMLGLRSELSELMPQFAVTLCATIMAVPPSYPAQSEARGCASKTARGLLFRDSFADAFIPLLSEHFQRLTTIWQRPDASAFMHFVATEQPQFVIEQRAERYLALVPADVLPVD